MGTLNTSSGFRLLTPVIREINRPARALSNMFFSQEEYSDKEDVYIDRRFYKRELLAPFVHEENTPVFTRRRGFETLQIKPAHIKLAEAINPEDIQKRIPGEALGQSFSKSQRKAARATDIALDHLDMYQARREWMATNLMVNGSYDITYASNDSYTIDMGRAAALTLPPLTGNAAWWNRATGAVGSAADVVGVVQQLRQLIRKNGGGGSRWDLIVGTDVLLGMQKVPEFVERIANTDLAGVTADGSYIKFSPVDYDGLETIGRLGNIAVHVNSAMYTDFDGTTYTETEYFDPGKIVLICGDNYDGRTHFGGLRTMEDYVPEDYRVSYIERRRSNGHMTEDDVILFEAAPIVYAGRPNCSASIEVVVDS